MSGYFENINEILNIDHLCEILDVGKSTAYKLLKSGEIKGFKIGKVWKVPVKSVEAFVMANVNLLD